MPSAPGFAAAIYVETVRLLLRLIFMTTFSTIV